jgi:hypothetical protein
MQLQCSVPALLQHRGPRRLSLSLGLVSICRWRFELAPPVDLRPGWHENRTREASERALSLRTLREFDALCCHVVCVFACAPSSPPRCSSRRRLCATSSWSLPLPQPAAAERVQRSAARRPIARVERPLRREQQNTRRRTSSSQCCSRSHPADGVDRPAIASGRDEPAAASADQRKRERANDSATVTGLRRPGRTKRSCNNHRYTMSSF